MDGKIEKRPSSAFCVKQPNMLYVLYNITILLSGNSATERNYQIMRKCFHVVPNGSNWQLIHNGQVIGNYYIKASAITDGRRIARANQPSELFIHNADGTIAERETYGNDPFPPRG